MPNSWSYRYVPDEAAFPAVIDSVAANGREHPALAAFIWAMVSDRPDATTLAHACLARIRALGPCDADQTEPLRRYRIIANLCLRSSRPQQRVQRFIQQAIAPVRQTDLRDAKPAEGQEPDERPAVDLRRALDSLRPPTRAVLLLRECFGLSYAEVGWVLGVPRADVARTLYSARFKLLQRVSTPGHSADASRVSGLGVSPGNSRGRARRSR